MTSRIAQARRFHRYCSPSRIVIPPELLIPERDEKRSGGTCCFAQTTAILKTNEHGAQASACAPDRLPVRSTNAQQTLLLRLQRFDVLGKVRHALLYLTLVPMAHIHEQRSPHRHLLGAMCGNIGFTPDGARDFQGGIFSSIALAQQS